MTKSLQLANDGGDVVRTESSIGEPFKDVKTDTHHLPHQNQDGNELEQAAHAQLISTTKRLRRKCKALRLRAVAAEINAQKAERKNEMLAADTAVYRQRVIELLRQTKPHFFNGARA